MTEDTIYTNPSVKLVKAFENPFKNVIATARTCYSSKGIIQDESVDLQKYTGLAKSIYEAGHHTTFQHATFQFQLANVSRQFIWSFLHSHPFYNSEQVSQRYVEVKSGSYFVPPIKGASLDIYLKTADIQLERYHRLTELLMKPSADEYYKIFPNRRNDARFQSEIKKKAQEIARYVLPIATFSYLYHTISGLTLLRYYRISESGDVPFEQRVVARLMVEEVLRLDPNYQIILQEPLDEAFFVEHFDKEHVAPESFFDKFDRELNGKTSKLVDYKMNGETLVADAVREVLGMGADSISDNEAIELAVNPSKNRIFGDSLVLTMHDKLSRTLYHSSYTFKKKLSHTADSQDQRHRTIPASRPQITSHLRREPDYITPELIKCDSKALKVYDETMQIIWDGIGALLKKGVSREFASYLLPNAFPIRFTESADLLNLHHKLKMRLCYNAQEEIWRASIDEAIQISEVHPRLGRYLLPPCSMRQLAGVKPYCPEGKRYCGVPVWNLRVSEYSRLI
ncbi:MAG: FAD-dependent thymidylate synthase [Candidatus Kryptoniota bacterium]